MTLADYLAQEHLTPVRFAGKIGLTVSAIRAVLDGNPPRRIDTARRISEATAGVVSMQELGHVGVLAERGSA